MSGPLGFIEKKDRTPEQQKLHEDISNAAPRFALARPTVPKGTKILLSDYWNRIEVINDCRRKTFTGFRQLSGSCVGVSCGDAIFTLAAVQRMIGENPTQAFIPWWPFAYGRSRYNSGIRGRGEGSITSIMGQTVVKEGVDDAQDLATYDTSDGYCLPKNTELNWSDGASSLVTSRMPNARQFPVGTLSPIGDVDGIAASVINGSPILNGCNYYVGGGRVSDGIAFGSYNGRGGHATTVLGYWEHETFGPLYLYHNQWNGSTYPEDSSGKPRCSVWLTENEMKRLFQLGGDDAETMSLSHLNYHLTQPRVLDWAQI